MIPASPFAIALIAALIVAGAIVGGILRARLPDHHLSNETASMVKVGIGFLRTLAALVRGLIITSAKSSFDTKSKEVQTAAAKIYLLDHNLQQMGSTADPARKLLRQIVSSRLADLRGNESVLLDVQGTASAALNIGDLQDVLRARSSAGEAQRLAWMRSPQLTDDLAQIKSLAIAQSGSTITIPLLVLLVSWLVFIALGMNVSAPRHGTSQALDVLCAVSAADAIFMILEMDRPFGGMIRISDAPLRAALLQLIH